MRGQISDFSSLLAGFAQIDSRGPGSLQQQRDFEFCSLLGAADDQSPGGTGTCRRTRGGLCRGVSMQGIRRQHARRRAVARGSATWACMRFHGPLARLRAFSEAEAAGFARWPLHSSRGPDAALHGVKRGPCSPSRGKRCRPQRAFSLLPPRVLRKGTLDAQWAFWMAFRSRPSVCAFVGEDSGGLDSVLAPRLRAFARPRCFPGSGRRRSRDEGRPR